MPEPEEHKPHGFAFAVPAHIAEAIQQDHRDYHDRVNMAADDRENRVFDFLNGLDVEQLMTLRMISNIDRDASFMQYIDGLAVGWLIHKHQVNPITGKSVEQALADTINKSSSDGPDRSE